MLHNDTALDQFVVRGPEIVGRAMPAKRRDGVKFGEGVFQANKAEGSQQHSGFLQEGAVGWFPAEYNAVKELIIAGGGDRCVLKPGLAQARYLAKPCENFTASLVFTRQIGGDVVDHAADRRNRRRRPPQEAIRRATGSAAAVHSRW